MNERKTISAGESHSLCSCTQLRKATRRITQIYDEALAPTGVKITQRGILAQIRRSEPVSVGALAEALVMDAGALAHTLKPLERDGLVSVTVDRADRRNRLISLTRQGQAKLKQTDELWEKAQKSFEKAFGRGKSEALREALQFLISEQFAETFAGEVAAGRPRR